MSCVVKKELTTETLHAQSQVNVGLPGLASDPLLLLAKHLADGDGKRPDVAINLRPVSLNIDCIIN